MQLKRSFQYLNFLNNLIQQKLSYIDSTYRTYRIVRPKQHDNDMANTIATAATVKVLLNNEHCYLIRNCLDLSEQITIYNDILHRSKDTDNSSPSCCMNPSPKTIIFDGNQSTLKLFNDGDDNVYAALIVQTANDILKRELKQTIQNNNNEQILVSSNNNILSDDAGSTTDTTTMSIGVIRYDPPNGKFPKHIDHCNDNTWVYLLSLGCSANFLVEKENRHNNADDTAKQSFQFKSGDVLVFDPSSNAAIVHGVNGINGDEFPLDGPEDFWRFRFGVQCRVKR